jgi:hypothetical protein
MPNDVPAWLVTLGTVETSCCGEVVASHFWRQMVVRFSPLMEIYSVYQMRRWLLHWQGNGHRRYCLVAIEAHLLKRVIQEDRIKPALMPLMTLCTTAIDIVPLTREKVADDIVKFLGTDSVCFFADRTREPGLRELQDETFGPIIDWFEKRFGVKVQKQ